MGDDFDNAMEYWAFAARLLEEQLKREGHEEDHWEIIIHDAVSFSMEYCHDGGSSGCLISLEKDLLENIRDEIRSMVDKLPLLAAQGSPW